MSVAPNYTRSQLYNYFDLSAEQQTAIAEQYGYYDYVIDNQYVILNDTALPLFEFVRTDYPNLTNKKPYWDGFYGTSYFSAYFIKLSKCGTVAVVAERFS